MGTRFATAVKNDGNAINNLFDMADQAESFCTPIALAAAASATLTAAQTINGMVSQTGGSTCALTTPTAAQIVAALKNAEVGSCFNLSIQNSNSGSTTLTAGTGITITGVATVATGVSGTYRGVVTNVGTPAVTFFRAA